MAVVEAGGLDVQGLLADQAAALAVVQGVAEGDLDTAFEAGDGAFVAVVQACAVEGQALPARQQPALVVQF
ncbi:hypothetical protein, partial [Pseudomonas sp. NFPP09]